ncbi:hypothetical protein [uncultured Kordia sp.]|uniref:hypothetical protein n=1 Tax=uncultured Kordia sp. TaxID=507699 RepID=UPI002627537D|nr:hypothetical protein [uncultured Kordia sp.]
MEILYYLSALCLLLFMVIATYDGFYLHIWKYELFNRKDSIFEHKVHTIRALLFPLIVWLLFINTDATSFWISIVLITIDFIVLGIDAYAETDSRKSIGGLPKWEYILHLFANSFHFASIFLLIATKIEITETGIIVNEFVSDSFAQQLMKIISVNMIPGAIILGFVHLILLFPKGIYIWNKLVLNIRRLSFL